MTDTDRTEAAEDLKNFTVEELEITLKALHAATAIRTAIDGVAEERKEDLADLSVEFALDSGEESFEEHIALVSAEIASRAN